MGEGELKKRLYDLISSRPVFTKDVDTILDEAKKDIEDTLKNPKFNPCCPTSEINWHDIYSEFKEEIWNKKKKWFGDTT